MLFYFFTALIFAKHQGYSIKKVYRLPVLYPYFALEAIFLFLQCNILLKNYTYVAYSALLKNAYIYILLIPILYYRLYQPALVGCGSILLGTFLNRFVIAQNGGKMPVFAFLSKWTGYFSPQAIEAVNGVHIIGDANTKFWFLSDFIDTGFCILSVGDIFIHAFTGIVIYYTIKAAHQKTATYI